MNILGIETSCDETSFALIKGEGDTIVVEKSFVASQIETHAKYGGVVPEVAAREHVEALFPLLHNLDIDPKGTTIDAIAVTAGPGLVPALRIGVACATTLALAWNKPLIAVNHLEGHLYSSWASNNRPSFPLIALLVSGGHTEIILMKDHGDYELIGMTRDDAVGEAFDKVAKLLGLGYPGGPIVSKKAEQGNPEAIDFPRPMLHSGDYDFSFSGLKTAVSYYLKEHPDHSVDDVCASFQEAAVDILTTKTLRAVAEHQPKSVIISGGVSANKRLREHLGEQLQKKHPTISYHLPELQYTTDNAVMIATAGYFQARNKNFADPITLQADPNLRLA